MGGKGAMPAMPAPVIQAPPTEAEYLPDKAALSEIPQVTQALGVGTVEDQEIFKPNLFVTPKKIGTSSTKGLLSE